MIVADDFKYLSRNQYAEQVFVYLIIPLNDNSKMNMDAFKSDRIKKVEPIS